MFLRYVAVDVFSNVTADRIYLSSMRTFTFMRMVIVFHLDDSTIQNKKKSGFERHNHKFSEGVFVSRCGNGLNCGNLRVFLYISTLSPIEFSR